MIRIVLVDDHPVVRMGLRGMLDAEEDLTVVGEASSGPKGVQLAAEQQPDIVLMDLRMPGGDGVEATGQIPPSAWRQSSACSPMGSFNLLPRRHRQGAEEANRSRITCAGSDAFAAADSASSAWSSSSMIRSTGSHATGLQHQLACRSPCTSTTVRMTSTIRTMSLGNLVFFVRG
ncbi:response regulator transcription factor [Micromonospora sp. NPDC049102]|uniref:response regulator n=1 Tax=Micromonospora sp. NPDC049102 TaxID=3364265 RepID=UPI00370F963F